MTAISITQAKSNLYKLLAEVNNNSEPITLTNSRGKNGVLISEDDWNAIQETLYLNSVPGIAESILESKADLNSGTVYDEHEEW
ncbi:MAG: type II toxin-antitoxin system Phd/YefM family antitoxin [Lachnospiraceae bacterium]|nr:type II toxin-antitoxin system Phd/YefM family antitoxin [Lachnospiraceae bacterium]